jgi:hypothetical protein
MTNTKGEVSPRSKQKDAIADIWLERGGDFPLVFYFLSFKRMGAGELRPYIII